MAVSVVTLTLVLAMVFGFVSAVGGVLLALGGSLPISPYITTISFLIYVVARWSSGVKAISGLHRDASAGRRLGAQD